MILTWSTRYDPPLVLHVFLYSFFSALGVEYKRTKQDKLQIWSLIDPPGMILPWSSRYDPALVLQVWSCLGPPSMIPPWSFKYPFFWPFLCTGSWVQEDKTIDWSSRYNPVLVLQEWYCHDPTSIPLSLIIFLHRELSTRRQNKISYRYDPHWSS